MLAGESQAILFLCLVLEHSSDSNIFQHGHVNERQLATGHLSIAGLSMILYSAVPHNKYVLAPHRYGGDMLRIALPTSHLEGTVYILSSSAYVSEAVWSPKIKSEHEPTDAKMMALFESIRAGSYSLSKPLRRLQTMMSNST